MLWVLLISVVSAYLEEEFTAEVFPTNVGISDSCTLYTSENSTYLKFHGSEETKQTDIISDIFAVNNACDLVVFGHPQNNTVTLWRPIKETVTTIYPEQPDEIEIHRFGFSVDVQNQTWIVGAPGKSNDHLGKGSTIGYAFVYEGDQLHSCRSLYDTYNFPDGFSKKQATYGEYKNYYMFLKIERRYEDVFNDFNTSVVISDEEMIEFQKICIHPQQPYYSTGAINPVLMPNFKFQQFGYSVALSGQLGKLGTSLFVSAPGDTLRFMEDSVDPINYGRVYAWDLAIITPSNSPIPPFSWWTYSIFNPYIPPELAGATYRAFGRDIAASRSTLVVSTYPLYDRPTEPFIIVYFCSPENTTASNCQESPERGISLNDLPGNPLAYITNDMITYTDGKTRSPYISSNVDGDNLNDFQNEFIGKQIGVVGSNVIIPDYRYYKIYRFGNDARDRETHPFLQHANFATNTQHWILQNSQKITHMWPCPLGTTGPKRKCTWGACDGKCAPCELQYSSNDGWMEYCDPCPFNFTTYKEGKTFCSPFVPPIIPGISWKETLVIIIAIIGSSVGVFVLFVLFQYMCIGSQRKNRIFKDEI